MNKIAKLTILTATLVGSFTSCIEETLPTSIVTTDQAAASDTALEGMVGALATSMVDVFGAFGSTVAMHYDFAYPAVMIANDAMAGEVVSTSSEANAGYNWFSSWSSNLYLGPLYYAPAFHWTCYYTYIKAANDVISTISADAEWESDPTKMAYMAIAKTFRASYYLDMARIYEPLANVGNTDISAVERLTVPYVDENTTESDARNGERLDRDDMFEKIFADLAAAEDIYNTEGVKQPTNGTNPDMAVIYGLYARAYLWLGGFDSTKYETAVTYADQAIALSGAITTGAQWTSPTNGFNSAIDSWMWYLPQSSNSISNLVNYVAWLSPEATWGYGNMVQFGMRSSDYNRLGANDIRKSIVVGASVDYSKYASVTNLEEGDFNGLAPYTNL